MCQYKKSFENRSIFDEYMDNCLRLSFMGHLVHVIYTRDSIYAIARICYPSVRLSDGWIIEKWLKLGL